MGWGSELKFQKHSEWNYNHYFKILDRWWFEMNFLKKYTGGMDTSKFYSYMGSLHSLACFCACEDGLWRRHPESQISSFLFLDLHSQRDSGVSKLITNSIIHDLSKVININKKYVLSSKYIRIASITEMADH